MAIRSIEYLIELFPDKTGKEIKEIHLQDRRDEKEIFEARNNEKLKFIEDVNTNGGYFKGIFGLDQKYYYRVFNMEMHENGDIYMDVEKLVLMINLDGHKGTVMEPGRANLERRIDTYQECRTYHIGGMERVTEKEWNEVNDYLNKMVGLFW